MNRRSFIKRLSLLIAGWQMSGVLKNAWALEEIPTPLPYPGFISEYMKAAMNDYKVRQVLLKDSAINILKAYGGTGL